MRRFARPFTLAVALLIAHVPPARARDAETRVATPALWVVRDADTTIHLFGTFHLLPPGLSWNHGPVEEAFERADLLKLEVAGLSTDPDKVRALVRARGLAPPGARIEDGMSAADAAILSRAIADSGLPKAHFDAMRPWFAGVTLGVGLLTKLGLDPAKGVDTALETRAIAMGKPVEGFETAEEQMGFLADFPEPVQRAQLVATARDLDKARHVAPRMVEAWARGDIDALGRMMNEGLRETPELSRVLLTERNARWADWIAARMDRPGHVFVAVGAGHLAGPDRVQAMLRDRHRLKVERVRTAPATRAR
jgi:uncharacterized protein YbaP (TraB family)